MIRNQNQVDLTYYAGFLGHHRKVNPLKPTVMRWLHFKYSVSFRPILSFSISDIRALWRSGLSARVPECQKLKMVD